MKELLLYVLFFLLAVLVVLIILIIIRRRKRKKQASLSETSADVREGGNQNHPVPEKQEEEADEAAGAPPDEAESAAEVKGADDAESIKQSILSAREKGKKVPLNKVRREARNLKELEKETEEKDRDFVMLEPVKKPESAEVPSPPPKKAGGDSALGRLKKMIPRKPEKEKEVQPEHPEVKALKEKTREAPPAYDKVDDDDAWVVAGEFPEEGPVKDKTAYAVKGEESKVSEVMGNPEHYMGKPVAITGNVRLSSKGKDDFWYVLFDGTGSAVIRSREKLSSEKCKIHGRVEKTKLGQVFLEVQNSEEV